MLIIHQKSVKRARVLRSASRLSAVCGTLGQRSKKPLYEQMVSCVKGNSMKKKITNYLPIVPLSVPRTQQATYLKNIKTATRNSGKLFLFAGDQKIEHLNTDFYGKGIPAECANPRHLFEIAAQSPIGVFATQLGLISRYGKEFGSKINYLVKLNAKSNLVPVLQAEPMSHLLNTVDDVVAFARSSKLPICGVGYTLYLGSEHEPIMLAQAARIVQEAHKHGLIVVLWIYPRGKAVKDERSAEIIAGAAGVATCLGADFVKVNPPASNTILGRADLLRQAVAAAGNSGVICSGGSLQDEVEVLEEIHAQLTVAGSRGCAVGRNIHQRSLKAAVAMCKAIAAILFDGATMLAATGLLRKK